MARLGTAVLMALTIFTGCHGSRQHAPPSTVIVPERIPSSEVLMTATWGSDRRVGTTLQITLRNVGQRTLVFDTGLQRYPMANFSFSLQLPDQTWVELRCTLCAPGSFPPLGSYTIRLAPSQFLRFTIPFSTFVGSDPRTGDRIDIRALQGRLLIELQVPTPPGAEKRWPGYVNASIRLP